MKDEEIPRKHSTRYSDALDEMLGIRFKKGNMIQKAERLKQTQLVERPTTRHGRHGQVVTAGATNDSFLLSPGLDFTNTRPPKSDVIVKRWQRQCEEERGSDDEKEEEKEGRSDDGKKEEEEEEEKKSNSDNNDANRTENKSREEIQKLETDNDKPENNTIAIANGQDSDRSITTVRQKNQSSGVASNSSAIKKTKATERQVSKGNLRDTMRMRSTYTISRNKTDSELRKPVEKYSRTIALSESPSEKAAYEKWFREKLRQEREKRRKQKEKEEDERKAREERRKEAERNYEIWKQQSDEAMRERRRTKKEKAEALAKEKMEEMKRKKEEATQMFQAWKNDRLQKFAKERKQCVQNKENDELKKKHEMEIRNNEAQKAFNTWYEKNKIRNAEARRKLLKSRRTEEIQSRNTKEYKEALSREAYDVWLQIKESERHFNESLQGRIMKFDEMSRRSHLVPWVPPSNIIPRQFIPTGTRRHQSVKRSIRSNQTYKKFPSAIHRSKSALR
ncbi:hypothetical protein, variant [Loa loa]|uniref:Uncharacterized protein n=1 Tax=Loa loa TaxID=7209 RepID=A0A1S0UEL3_LOALO|nr:hypothetical protein, variant [Loa loa]EJD74112.1 hypothetical protein, variant [Loa loa]